MAITDDNARLQTRVDDWISYYEWLWRSPTNWLNQIERYWRRWHADPSLVRHLRDPWVRQLAELPQPRGCARASGGSGLPTEWRQGLRGYATGRAVA